MTDRAAERSAGLDMPSDPAGPMRDWLVFCDRIERFARLDPDAQAWLLRLADQLASMDTVELSELSTVAGRIRANARGRCVVIVEVLDLIAKVARVEWFNRPNRFAGMFDG